MRDLSAQLGEGEGILILDEEGPHGEGLQFKRTEEMAFLLGFPANLIYLAAEGSEEDDDVVLLGQMLQQTKDLRCMQEVQGEDRKEDDDRHGVPGQIRNGVQDIQHGFVYQQIVDRTDQTPEEGIKRTDDTAVVETVVRVIPQPDVQLQDEDISGDQLEQGHYSDHDQQDQGFRTPSFRIHPRKCDEGHQIKTAQSDAVDRKPRTGQKAGIDPFFCLSDGREKVPVNKLQTPAAHAAKNKDK